MRNDEGEGPDHPGISLKVQTSGKGNLQPALPDVSWAVPLLTVLLASGSTACSIGFRGKADWPLSTAQPTYLRDVNPAKESMVLQDGGSAATVLFVG